jgi:hypothetical protein
MKLVYQVGKLMIYDRIRGILADIIPVRAAV